jgi:Protein of unknown function (DUF3237)
MTDRLTAITPVLNFAFDIHVDLGQPVVVGRGRLGERRIFPIVGGAISGPRLRGRVCPGGADYALVRNDGCTIVSAHYMLEAEDGTAIYIRNEGLFVAPSEVIAQVDSGVVMAPDSYYFRAAPVFDAPDGPHAWLSDRLFVSSCAFRPTDVTISVYTVD